MGLGPSAVSDRNSCRLRSLRRGFVPLWGVQRDGSERPSGLAGHAAGGSAHAGPSVAARVALYGPCGGRVTAAPASRVSAEQRPGGAGGSGATWRRTNATAASTVPVLPNSLRSASGASQNSFGSLRRIEAFV